MTFAMLNHMTCICKCVGLYRAYTKFNIDSLIILVFCREILKHSKLGFSTFYVINVLR